MPVIGFDVLKGCDTPLSQALFLGGRDLPVGRYPAGQGGEVWMAKRYGRPSLQYRYEHYDPE
jgi:hypothetical protein